MKHCSIVLKYLIQDFYQILIQIFHRVFNIGSIMNQDLEPKYIVPAGRGSSLLIREMPTWLYDTDCINITPIPNPIFRLLPAPPTDYTDHTEITQ